MSTFYVFCKARKTGKPYWACIIDAYSEDDAYERACRIYGSLYVLNVHPV